MQTWYLPRTKQVPPCHLEVTGKGKQNERKEKGKGREKKRKGKGSGREGEKKEKGVKREVSGWMRCFTRDRSEARGQQPLTPLVCPSLNVLEAHPRQRSNRAHKSRRPSRSPRESPRAQLQNELPSRYKYKKLQHTHTAMHVKGTDKQADHRISTPGNIQAVRGNSDLPVRAWGAASTKGKGKEREKKEKAPRKDRERNENGTRRKGQCK